MWTNEIILEKLKNKKRWILNDIFWIKNYKLNKKDDYIYRQRLKFSKKQLKNIEIKIIKIKNKIKNEK